MANRHDKWFVINALLGILFIAIGIAVIIFLIFERRNETDYIFWTALPVVTITCGLFLFGNAFVHKVKADLSRRQSRRSKSDNY